MLPVGSVSSYNIEPIGAILFTSDRKPHQQHPDRKQGNTDSFQNLLNEAMKETNMKNNRYFNKFTNK